MRRQMHPAGEPARRNAKHPATDHPVEEELAAMWGERIAIGKQIARGGKASGYVAGAMESS